MIKWIKKSLTVKWMTFIILLATLPLAIAGYQIIQIYQVDLKRSIIENEKMKANMVVEKTEAFFENVLSGLFSLSLNEGFIKGGPFHQKGHLENLLYQNNHLIELNLLDRKGRETIKVSKYTFESLSGLEDRSKSEMFKVVSAGGVYWGEFSLDKDVTPSMTVAIPVKESNGQLKNVLSGRITFPYLWNLIPKPLTDTKGVTYVVDDHGTLIAHTDINSALARLNVKDLPMVKKVLDGKEGNLEFEDSKGETFLAIYKPIHKWGWGVIIQVPVVEAYKPLQQVARTAFQWILITLGLAMIISLILTRRLTVPIRLLSREMKKVSEGDMNIHVQSTTTDEVGVLTDSFNQMVKDLRDSQGALKEAELKYRNIFESSKDMVFITSKDGKLIDMNQAGVEGFGFNTKEELIRTPVKELYANPEERHRYQNEIAKEGFVKDFELRLKKKDGSVMECLITASLRKDKEGGVIGYEGIIKNITSRKRMEEELVRRSDELRTLNELGMLINQTLDMEKMLPVVLERTLSLTGFETGAVHLLNEDETILKLKWSHGLSPLLTEEIRSFEAGEGICGAVIRSGKPIVCSTDDYPTPRLIPHLKEVGLKVFVGIPLTTKGRYIGSIVLASSFPHHLTQREIDLLESIGNQIGLAIDNAQLFSNVEKAKSEWETTFDSVTDSITIMDKEYRILRANKSVFARYGKKPGELIGKKCYEVFYHREVLCEECGVSDTLRTSRPSFRERESKLFGGIFQFLTFPMLDENGDVIGAVEAVRDVSEQKLKEKENDVINNINKILASSFDVRHVFKSVHSELKKVLNSERMSFILLNNESQNFEYFALERDYESGELTEGAAYSLKGTPAEEAVKTGLPVIVTDTRQRNCWISQKLVKEGILSLLVYPMEYKGKIFGTMGFGSRAVNHFSNRHLMVLQQVAPGLAISVQNSLLLREVRASEEKYRTVVEGVYDGVAVLGTDFKFKFANKRLEEVLGYSQEELIGMDFRNVLAEESRAVISERYMKWVNKAEKTPTMEFIFLRKDKEIRHMEIRNREVKDIKGDMSFVALMKDITEKKKMEEQLLQTEKLRSLGEMASGVAHDFNNALAAILGNAQLMLYTVQDEEMKASLRTIEKVARDAAHTVKRLQDFTRKRSREELFKLHINSLIKDAVEITKPKWKDDAQGRGMQIDMGLNLGKISPVEGNASEVREVITNLIFNSIEAMPAGGKIEIRTYEKGGKVFVQVADTGIGMTDEVRRKIFDPFFTTKPFSNSGLGLSMSYGIIKRFGGEIECESKVGIGTTLTLILPVNMNSREEQVSEHKMKKGKNARILVIEDEETVRDVLSQMLFQVNHEVTVAKNGEEGLRLFSELEFDMVLTDLGMPGMSGWEVCQKIKEVNPYMPVGMITGWGAELDNNKVEEYGLDFLISKPFDVNQVLRTVSETIESRTERKREWA